MKFSWRLYFIGKGMLILNNLYFCFCFCFIVFIMFIMVWMFILFILYLKYFIFVREFILKIFSSIIVFVWFFGVIDVVSISIVVVLFYSIFVNIWKIDILIKGIIKYNVKSLYNFEFFVNWCIDRGLKVGKRFWWEFMFCLGNF